MGYYKQKWLQLLEECEVILYRKGGDYMICLSNSESDANIKIRIEKQTHKQLLFSD